VYFVFLVFLFHTAYVLYYCERGGVDLMGLKPNPQNLSSFSALTLLIRLFDPQKPFPNMTYNVFGGTLNLARLQLLVQTSFCQSSYIDVAATLRATMLLFR